MNDLHRQRQLEHIHQCLAECDKRHSQEEVAEAEKYLGVSQADLISDLFKKAA